MERCMLGITRRDREMNTWVSSVNKVADIAERVKKLNLKLNIARSLDGRWTREILE
jgi:hypothetical protein